MSELTTTEAALTGLLAYGDASGYDLKRRVDASVGYFWLPAKSQIYAVLPRLVESGFATRRVVPHPSRPDKHVYRLSRKGRAALRRWLAEPAGDDSGRLLLKIFFGDLVEPEVVLRHIRDWRERMESLERDLEAIEAGTDPSPDDLYRSLTRAYGLEYTRALTRWTKLAETRLARQPEAAR
jgi:DNA-binding PadR family transcriptional regulator